MIEVRPSARLCKRAQAGSTKRLTKLPNQLQAGQRDHGRHNASVQTPDVFSAQPDKRTSGRSCGMGEAGDAYVLAPSAAFARGVRPSNCNAGVGEVAAKGQSRRSCPGPPPHASLLLTYVSPPARSPALTPHTTLARAARRGSATYARRGWAAWPRCAAMSRQRLLLGGGWEGIPARNGPLCALHAVTRG